MIQTKTTTNSILAMTSVIVLSTAGIFAQGIPDPFQSYLPTNRTVEVMSHAGSFALAPALETALNSPGDAVTVQLSGEVSVGLVINVGTQVDFEIFVTRTAEDFYTLSVGYGVALTGGVEVVQDIEVNAGAGFGQSQEWTFLNFDDLIQGINALIMRVALGGDGTALANSFESALESSLAKMGDLDSAIAEAELRMAQATSAIGALKILRKAVLGSLRKFERVVRKVERILRRLPFGRGKLSRKLKSFRKKLRKASRKVDSWERKIKQAKAKLEKGKRLREKHNLTKGQEDYILREARRRVEAAASIVTDLLNYGAYLDRHYSAKTWNVRVFGEGSFSAGSNALIPGVSMENCGVGASASLEFDVNIRHQSERTDLQQAAAMIITRTLAAEGAANAGMGVGVLASLGTALIWEDVYDLLPKAAGERQNYQLLTASLSFSSTADFYVQVGLGLCSRQGVARESTITVDRTEANAAIVAGVIAIFEGSTANIGAAAQSVNVEFTITDRWETGMVMGGGQSTAGSGFNLSGSLMWGDTGVPETATLPFGTTLQLLGQGAGNLLTASLQ